MSDFKTMAQKIKPRFFLRRWIDRGVLACIEWSQATPAVQAHRKALSYCVFAAYWLPFILFGGTSLVGIVYPFHGLAWGLLAAGLAWPVRWALHPWVVEPDNSTVRVLAPYQYQLIQDFTSPEQIEQIVAWAAEDPYLDTRHLAACMENDLACFRQGRFSGVNALDLFDGLVGQRVRAIKQGRALADETPQVKDSAGVRRL